MGDQRQKKESQDKAGQKTLFGDKLASLRIKMGYKTQPPFANLLGVPLNTYKKWEQGKAMPHKSNLNSIIEKTGCDPDYFTGEIEKKNHDLQFICDYTGMTDTAVEVLHYLADGKQESHKEIVEVINYILETQIIKENSLDSSPYTEKVKDSEGEWFRTVFPDSSPERSCKDNILFKIRECLLFETIYKKYNPDTWIMISGEDVPPIKIADYNKMFTQYHYDQITQDLASQRKKKEFYKWRNGIKRYGDRHK